ncbi:MAG: Mur ligase domain-containing protein, partial [Kaistella sp.]
MNLEALLNRIPVLEISGNKNREISEIVFDSRKAVEHSLYVAVKGTVSDGHSFIDAAIAKGATTIVCENLPENLNTEITYITVKDASKTLGQLASNFYGNPSQKLNLIGITGTNGKTSVTTLLFDIFQKLGFKSALISTVEYRIADEIIPSTHTTP